MTVVPLLVVGTGPAGLSGSVQARRDQLDHLVVGDEPPGGLLPAAWRIDNLAAFPGGVTGERLGDDLARQATALDLPVKEGIKEPRTQVPGVVVVDIPTLQPVQGLFDLALG